MFYNKNNNKMKLLERIWKLRDFELSNLWQRSIFLTAFITTTYIAYGSLLKTIIKEDFISNFFYNIGLKKLIFYDIVAMFIALIGILISSLWIMMAKGSKFWYENYEKYINELENEMNITLLKNKEIGTQGIIKEKNEYNDNLLNNTSAGKYSPSRINIMLGIISISIWFILYIFHYCVLISLICKLGNYYCILCFGSFLLILPFCLVYLIKIKVKTSY